MKQNEDMVKTTSDPNVVQITIPDERFYYIKDHKIYLPSFTWILDSYPKSYAFMRWLAEAGGIDVAEQIRDEAGARGSKVHNAITDLLKGKKVTYDDKYFNENKRDFEKLSNKEWTCLMSFQRFCEDFDPKVKDIDKVTYSLEHEFAGTLDQTMYISKAKLIEKKVLKEDDLKGLPDDLLVLIDNKTSSAIYVTNFLQVVGYKVAEIERDNPCDLVAILRLGTKHKSGYEFKVLHPSLEPKYWDYCQRVKAVHHIENNTSEPQYKEIPETIELNLRKK